MASSTLNMERRSGPTRRCGMTVLGKVPKPINLPSQRSENNGLDPGIEIVPKGTISWGSRSSVSVPNVWGTSARSPNTDSGSGSPSFPNSRPSSGGSAWSSHNTDKTNDLISNARGQGSRPSSAHGTLTSNQISSASLRPRSAETKPCSPLSKSTDLLRENYGVWSGTSITERMTSSTNSDGFSLKTGEFPTLGSEKNNTRRGTEIQGPLSRPGSSAGTSLVKDSNEPPRSPDMSVKANEAIVSANVREVVQCGDLGGIHPGCEKSRSDNGPFPYTGVSIQHSQQWRGPHIQGGGLWLRGPSGGPPYVTSAPLSVFPPDQFSYYRAQVTPPIFSQPQPGAGVRAPLPQCSDQHLSHVPDSYVRPGVPVRPGYYPGPFPYDGFYGPVMGYCNPNERDSSFIGTMAGTGPCNTTPCQGGHLDPSNSRPLHTGHGPTRRGIASSTPELFHGADNHGPSKIMLRQHNGSGKVEQIRGENHHMCKKSDIWEESSPRTKKEHSADTRSQKLPQEVEGPRFISSHFSPKKSGGTALPSYTSHMICADPKDIISTEGVDSLNTRSQSHDANVHHSSLIPADDRHNTRDLKMIIPKDDSICQQRKYKSVSSSDRQADNDGAQEQVNRVEVDSSSDIISIEKIQNEGDEQLLLRLTSDENQRERMKELARQRAKKLQEEEEVRSREQKAKAQAKLEELERRVKARSSIPNSEANPQHGPSPSDQVLPSPESILGPTPKISHAGTGWDDPQWESPLENITHGEVMVSSPQRRVCTGNSPGSRPSGAAHSKQRQPLSSVKYPDGNLICDGTPDPAASAPDMVGKQISPSDPSVVTEISVNQRRKGNNRGGRNKAKADGIPPVSAVSQKSRKGVDGFDVSDSDGGTQSIVQPSSEMPSNFSGDRPQLRGNAQWRPAYHRKLQKSMPPPVTKFGGGESVMWAPVKIQEKTESANDKPPEADFSESDALNLEQGDSSGNSRLKRAELERYVPKAAAKEPGPRESDREKPPTLTFGTHVYQQCDASKSEESGGFLNRINGHENERFDPELKAGDDGQNREGKQQNQDCFDPELKAGGDNRQNKQGKQQQHRWRQRGTGFLSKKDKDANIIASGALSTEGGGTRGGNYEGVKGTQVSAEVEAAPILRSEGKCGADRGNVLPQNTTVNHKTGNRGGGGITKEGRGERLVSQWQPKSQASTTTHFTTTVTTTAIVTAVPNYQEKGVRGEGGGRKPVSESSDAERHVVGARPKQIRPFTEPEVVLNTGADDGWGFKGEDERERQVSPCEYQPVRGRNDSDGGERARGRGRGRGRQRQQSRQSQEVYHHW